MSKITRVTQPIFASGAANNGQFGSGQLGTKVTTDSLPTIMALSAWSEGWLDATIGASKFPPLEEMQGIDYVITTQLAYLFQEGVPEYDAATTYFENSIVKQPGTFNLYGSIIDNNIGNALTDPSAWKFLLNLSLQGSTVFEGSAPTGGAANVQTLTTTAGTWTNTVGNLCFFQAGLTNTAALTLNIDGIGAVSVKKEGSSGLIALAAGDITNGQSYSVVSNGAVYVLQSSFNPSAFLQVASNLSDVGNAATALANIGGLAKSANLSDVANPTTALANLGGISSLTPGNGNIGAYSAGYRDDQTMVFALGTTYSAATVNANTSYGFNYTTGTWMYMSFMPGIVGGWGGTNAFCYHLFQRVS